MFKYRWNALIAPRSEFSQDHRKPKVLCIIETLGAGGGAEELQVKLLPAIGKQGYDVEIVALFDWQPDLGLLLEEQGFTVHRLRLAGRWALLTGLLKLWALRRTKRYRLIWGHLLFGNLYAVLFALMHPATKSIITLHSEYACLPLTTLKARVSVMIQKWVLGLSTAKVAVSRASAESHTKFFGWRPIEVIHNGVATKDIPPFPNAEERAQIRRGLRRIRRRFPACDAGAFHPRERSCNAAGGVRPPETREVVEPKAICLRRDADGSR